MNPINKPLNVLLIEDNTSDVYLTLRELKKHWLEVKHLNIESIAELSDALKSVWDIILCDFNLPGFDGMTALRIIRESGNKTPFILVSSAVPEDVAALMMRLGANDYVMKDNLSRLAPAILRELKSGEAPIEKSVLSNQEKKTHNPFNKLLPPVVSEAKESFVNNPIAERHKAVINMLVVAEYIRKHQSAILEKQNLTFPRLNILRILKQVFPESISIKSIQEKMIYKTIDLSRMVDKMNKEGFVNSTVSIKKKTAKEIAITSKGLEVLNTADKYYDEMFLPDNYLSEENAKQINEALQSTLHLIK